MQPHNRLGEDQDMSQWLEENGQGVLNGAPSLSPQALEELGRKLAERNAMPFSAAWMGLSDELRQRALDALPALLAAASRERGLVRENGELRAAIFGGADYWPSLKHGNFVEMAKTLHDAQKGGLARATASEAREADLIRERDEARRRSDHWRDKALKDTAQIAALQERVGVLEGERDTLDAALSELGREIGSWEMIGPDEEPSTVWQEIKRLRTGVSTCRPIETAPKDHTWVRLLVRFDPDGHWAPLEDAAEAWTIGFNGADHTGEDEWVYAGWDWSHDCITEARGGQIIGWMPFETLSAEPATGGKEGGADD